MGESLGAMCRDWRARGERAVARAPRGVAEAVWVRLAGGASGSGIGAGVAMEMGRAAHARASEAEGLDEGEVTRRAAAVGERFELGRWDDEGLVEALGMLGALASRRVGMAPYAVQLAGAAALTRGAVVEMATGEGKTLVAGLAACALGWRRRGAHVLTVNDYLAERDLGICAPLLEAAGVDAGLVVGGTDPAARRAAYGCAVTYTTHKEAAADFLRDAMRRAGGDGPHASLARTAMGDAGPALAQACQRGLSAAIVDEADSILVDDATTPLALSERPEDGDAASGATTADGVARSLRAGRDFEVMGAARRVFLTARGEERVMLDGRWDGATPMRRRLELATLALSAREVYERDRDYVVAEGKVVIVDESTGRLLPDRSWRAGLHQAVEAAEGVAITAGRATTARISFQRFFRSYDLLSGMTGTAREVSGELEAVYGLSVVALPTHRPVSRRVERASVYGSAAGRDAAVIDAVVAARAEGRPVLVGTRSVSASEALSSLLAERGIEHRVLNAVRHREEAAIVAGGGRAGAVTIATNMAGRGTDIRLDGAARAAGGLMVISAEVNDSTRLDRQLFGRGARQGDPGGARAMVSLDDPVVRRFAPGWLVRGLGALGMGEASVVCARWNAGRAAARMRRRLMRGEYEMELGLGFVGE